MSDHKRILFLFNHDAAHQAAHIAGIMSTLAMTYPQIEAIAATGNAAIAAQLRKLVPADAAQKISWVDIGLGVWRDAALSLPNQLFPAKRIARLRLGQALFKSVDAIVSTERTCLRVKDRLTAEAGEKIPMFIYVPHGSGDRNVAYHPDLARFDYHLLSGQKLVDEMISHGLAEQDQCRIIGYPKFDMVSANPSRGMFANDKPVILYNPHFDPHLSSWYGIGPQLLEALAQLRDKFNIVCAPHVMLFRKKLHISPEYMVMRLRPEIPDTVKSLAGVHIDTASPALFDMTYTTHADIYIGDVSSQMYEFLRKPGPCIFLDTAKQGADAYPFWANGPVTRTVEQVLAAVDRWVDIAVEYESVQRRLFHYSISHDPECSASERGAQALAQIVG